MGGLGFAGTGSVLATPTATTTATRFDYPITNPAINLTTQGSTDWAVFGPTLEHKIIGSTPANWISNASALTSFTTLSSFSFNYSYIDGTPTLAATGQNYYYVLGLARALSSSYAGNYIYKGDDFHIWRRREMFFGRQMVLGALAAVTLATALAPVQAAAAIVDFQIIDTADAGSPMTHKSGQGAIGLPSDPNWNSYNLSSGPGLTTGALPDTSGSPTNTVIALSDGFGSFDTNHGKDPLINQYAVLHAATITITLSNLAPLTPYNVYLYSNNDGDTAGGSFTVTTGTTTGGTQAPNPDDQNPSPPYILNHDYVAYTGATAITSDANGKIVIQDAPGSVGYAILNGLQIQGTFATPEPGSLALAGVGMAGLLARRRRRLA